MDLVLIGGSEHLSASGDDHNVDREEAPPDESERRPVKPVQKFW
jgi:hypothetical protein